MLRGSCLWKIFAFWSFWLDFCDCGTFLYQPTNNNGRLSLAEYNNYNYHEPEGPGTYAFGYDIEDPATNNIQFRNEERHPNGTVTGSYGYVEPGGNVRIVHYVADHNGYRATEETGMRLSMLKPVTFPPTAINENLQLPSQILDQRLRPTDQLGFLNQIQNAPQDDLFESSRFDYYQSEGGNQVAFPDYSPEYAPNPYYNGNPRNTYHYK